ncbi:hypothetical protein WMF45_36630 [Sorangium sp. So ce448]|uniref:hypothetical protein n=1 Tax=Sorangium sp. So ce448 TaxID=3133314 RepID=UPI003F631BDD
MAEYCDVPSETGVFPMWHGMTDSNLIHGEQYWASQAGVDDLRAILSAHPEIRYSMWSSSSEISEQTEEQVQRYLDTLDEYEHTHTTQDSCEDKARAFWRMMAELEGCSAH